MPAANATRTSRRALLGIALASYGALLVAIVFWPKPVDRGFSSQLGRFLDGIHSLGVPSWVDYGMVESAANVLLFFPEGLLLAAWLSLRWAWCAAAAGIVCSAAIEAGQSLLLPERFGTPQDVIANGLGAALGTIVVYAFRVRRLQPATQTQHPARPAKH